MADAKKGLSPVEVLEQSASPDNASVLEKQTRTRRLFSGTQLFALSLVYFGTWYSVGSNMYYALDNGGPATWFFSYIVVLLGALCQAASFGEMASILPIAGAQYFWTYSFGPPRTRLFLTWIQGWTTWLGYVAMLSSCLNSVTVVLEGMVQLSYPNYTTGGWHTTLVVLAMLGFCVLVNLYAFKLVPWFELLSGVLYIILFFIFAVILFRKSSRNSGAIFLESSISSGWDNYFVSANVGSLSSLFLFLGFEGVIHMGEETRNARAAVPRALFWSVATNGLLGMITIVALGLCMPSVDVLLASSSPLVTILLEATGSVKATTAMVSGLTVMGISGTMSVVSSVSRLSWAWARDGGLPRYFGHVDAQQRVPARAVLLTSALATALALLNLGNATYVALNAILSLSTLALYVSYAIVLYCVLYARLSAGGNLGRGRGRGLKEGAVDFGEWNWGPYAGPLINAVAFVYTCYVIIWLPFPSELPVTAANMNYCGPVYGAVLIGALTYWFVWARKHWKGPNEEILRMALKGE